MAVVAGVDGAKGGWIVVRWDLDRDETAPALARAFSEVLSLVAGCALTLLDMPIGLLDAAQHGGRECDRAARCVLKPHGSRVFSPPARPTLRASSFDEAKRINRGSSPHGLGLSIQTYCILPKLRDVDEAMTPALQERVRESHPEVAFARLNGGIPLASKKKSSTGRAKRRELLVRAGVPGVDGALAGIASLGGVAADDLLDAFVLAEVARRAFCGCAKTLPADPRRDSRRLRMEIWY